MSRVLGSSVWVGTVFYGAGTPESEIPADVAEAIGAHAWDAPGTQEPASLPVDDDDRVLTATVWVGVTEYVAGTPATAVPIEARSQIGDHAWAHRAPAPVAVPAAAEPEVAPVVETDEEPEIDDQPPAVVEPEAEPQPAEPTTPAAPAVAQPPASGPGSGVAHWAAYAAAVGVEVEAGASRAQIIEAVRDAGITVE